MKEVSLCDDGMDNHNNAYNVWLILFASLRWTRWRGVTRRATGVDAYFINLITQSHRVLSYLTSILKLEDKKKVYFHVKVSKSIIFPQLLLSIYEWTGELFWRQTLETRKRLPVFLILRGIEKGTLLSETCQGSAQTQSNLNFPLESVDFSTWIRLSLWRRLPPEPKFHWSNDRDLLYSKSPACRRAQRCKLYCSMYVGNMPRKRP